MENQKVLKNISLIKNEIAKALADSVNLNLNKEKKVKIIAISKRQPIDRILAALTAGHKVYGENQVQETLKKWPDLKKKFNNRFYYPKMYPGSA